MAQSFPGDHSVQVRGKRMRGLQMPHTTGVNTASDSEISPPTRSLVLRLERAFRWKRKLPGVRLTWNSHGTHSQKAPHRRPDRLRNVYDVVRRAVEGACGSHH